LAILVSRLFPLHRKGKVPGTWKRDRFSVIKSKKIIMLIKNEKRKKENLDTGDY
jgi:hypothetical protein